ncbi:CSEP0005 putative effector protein [Blumeria hordei DH14]|uniref:CSEP0005 putative effector protein n=1 Tax=Blumeria graminis f. sp. hordei (strain DH14) TaxID=546991 RepID=N1JEP9_BLUG1|nr:CSEP0005 putative effector protein [Blumeria hordei DH14]
MRTATLIACVGTWLLSLASTVQCADYICDNEAEVPAKFVNDFLSHARVQARNRQSGYSLENPGDVYSGGRNPLYWRAIIVSQDLERFNGQHYEYRIVYDSQFNLHKLEAVRLNGGGSETTFHCYSY